MQTGSWVAIFKMHLYIATRGHKQFVEKLISDLQAQYLPLKLRGVMQNVELGVRPIQLWELFFAEDQLPRVLATLEPQERGASKTGLAFLRKALKAKKIPKDIDKNVVKLPVGKQNVQIVPIGIREDIIHPTKGHEMV